jgi:hypothetical protein
VVRDRRRLVGWFAYDLGRMMKLISLSRSTQPNLRFRAGVKCPITNVLLLNLGVNYLGVILLTQVTQIHPTISDSMPYMSHSENLTGKQCNVSFGGQVYIATLKILKS